MKSTNLSKRHDWMFITLVVAGIYNLLWGAWVILFPTHLFELLDMKIPIYLEIWQCVGMIVGVYGIGYMIAATRPMVHWPIVLVGFLGKIFGPIGFAQALIMGKLPLKFGFNLITNDFIWWIPFFLILKEARAYYLEKYHFVHPTNTDKNYNDKDLISLLPKNIQSKCSDHQVFLIFLRHCGCTFTRDALTKISQVHLKPHQKISVVYMGDHQLEEDWQTEYQIHNIDWINDKDQSLYRAFGLKRAGIQDLFSWSLWTKALKGLLDGQGVGPLQGDGFQMPGVFEIQSNQVKEIYKYRDMSDNPDFHLLFSKA